ncbi:hypothetical protein BURPS1710A_4182 [Burkholderia pseudomallei 1710a]|uniref:Uncharacterized protein n=1 Tax=Burkholderia pseudomallei 1710a TaxID=320371 RepID=A0A0E1W8F2_BURPE|nr:hypothetical protein BURPS1710A_4182 [Burkholderia pseudomallei 1710a]
MNLPLGLEKARSVGNEKAPRAGFPDGVLGFEFGVIGEQPLKIDGR